MNREKVNEWLDNAFSEYTKEEDRKESIFYLLKRLQDNHDKEISKLLLEIQDAKNEIFRLNILDCNNCNYKPIDGESDTITWEKYNKCSNCKRYYEDKFEQEG